MKSPPKESYSKAQILNQYGVLASVTFHGIQYSFKLDLQSLEPSNAIFNTSRGNLTDPQLSLIPIKIDRALNKTVRTFFNRNNSYYRQKDEEEYEEKENKMTGLDFCTFYGMRYVNKLSLQKLKLLLDFAVNEIRKTFVSLINEKEYETLLVNSFAEAYNYYKYASEGDKEIIDKYKDKVFSWNEIKGLRDKFKEIEEDLSEEGYIPKKVKLKAKKKGLKPEELAIYKIRYIPLTRADYLNNIRYHIRLFQFSPLDENLNKPASDLFAIDNYVKVKAYILNDVNAKKYIIKNGNFSFEEQQEILFHGTKNRTKKPLVG